MVAEGTDNMAIRIFSRNRTRRPGAGALAVAAALAIVAAGDAAAATRYRVEGDASELRILAYRAGPLAGLGHNHVVVTRALSGSVLLDETAGASSVRLEFPVTSLEVDDPDLRAAEGPAFEGSIPLDDITATRRNMLGPELLDADSYPVIRIESTVVEGTLPNLNVRVCVTIRGGEYPLEVPVSVNTFDGGLVAVGRLRLAHSAIGLEPFSVALDRSTI
jgi:polyisoprenoid-binding protein YceI